MEELLDSLGGSGFINMTRRPLSDSLLELGVSQRFIDEVIAPVMRINYGQNVSIPAFVGQLRGKELAVGLEGGVRGPGEEGSEFRTSYEVNTAVPADVGQERGKAEVGKE